MEFYSGTDLYVGGAFPLVGGMPDENIASWDGAAWSDVTGPDGTGLNDFVEALRVYDDGTGPILYAGGRFDTADGSAADGLALWDGIGWSPMHGASFSGVTTGLVVYDDGTGPGLYISGNDLEVEGGPAPSNPIRWNGATWATVLGEDGFGLLGDVGATAVFDDGQGEALYMVRDDPACDGSTNGRIARWDGVSCTVVPGEFEQYADLKTLLAVDVGDGPRLYVGGQFTTIDGAVMNSIAAWDGDVWSPLAGDGGVGIDGTTSDLTAFDDGHGPALFAVGHFGHAGGKPSVGIARWGNETIFADGFESGDTSAWSSP